jgi:hypothetical protein
MLLRSAIFGVGLCCSISTLAQGDPVAIGPEDVILTRQRAEQMSPRELEALLLRDFPHGDIRTVEVGRSMEGFPEMPLSHVVFHEAGMAAGGRFCTARRIVVHFDTLHGKIPQDAAEQAANAPRRRFAVSEAPLATVLDQTATDAACARVENFAQLPSGEPQLGRGIVEAVLDLSVEAAKTGRASVPVTCLDDTTPKRNPCDGVRVLAGLNWRHLGNVDLPSSVRGPETQIQFWQGDRWVVEVTGSKPIISLQIYRRNPPPF